MRIIVDVMGGDNAPLETVKGVCAAAAEYTASYILVGNKPEIEQIAEENNLDLSRFEIVHTETVINMEDEPLSVMRAKSDSSMSVGLKMLAEGKGDAFVSTGNTGALFTGATLIVRKIKGISRAALAGVLPMNPPLLLLDCGANISVTDECLEQFAVMGSAYMKKMYDIEAPRVGLLNNGAESHKGTQLQIDAYKRLSERDGINFVGNIEANQVPFNACDVLVTDGFTGNILLKSTEGMGKLMMKTMKSIYSGTVAKMSALVVKKKLDAVKKDFDATEHGGAPLLGMSKPVIKAHGSSNAKAFKNAIRQAINYHNSGIVYDIAEVAADFAARKKLAKEQPAKAEN
ncbi:MAG: phosphate acyltransferase PlsX [Clostridia bacterium]|nr:phosphate acyltransferase PlsX [Clostridia bacterium]